MSLTCDRRSPAWPQKIRWSCISGWGLREVGIVVLARWWPLTRQWAISGRTSAGGIILSGLAECWAPHAWDIARPNGCFRSNQACRLRKLCLIAFIHTRHYSSAFHKQSVNKPLTLFRLSVFIRNCITTAWLSAPKSDYLRPAPGAWADCKLRLFCSVAFFCVCGANNSYCLLWL